MQKIKIKNFAIGEDEPLALFSGPCVIESEDHALFCAEKLKKICEEQNVNLIYKSSFDKANRTSVDSYRGPGIQEGLRILEKVKTTFDLPIVTDVHSPQDAATVAQVADVLQIPAFLCRQTDLVVAVAKAGKVTKVKKGQFMAACEMQHVLGKLTEAGCDQLMLTERGTFLGYHRLVNDFVGIGDLMELGPPVCFDVTHSTQLPGAGDGVSGGRPERAALLARAAVAAGVDAVFIECHPNPDEALSDKSTMQPLDVMHELLIQLVAICSAIAPQRHAASTSGSKV